MQHLIRLIEGIVKDLNRKAQRAAEGFGRYNQFNGFLRSEVNSGNRRVSSQGQGERLRVNKCTALDACRHFNHRATGILCEFHGRGAEHKARGRLVIVDETYFCPGHRHAGCRHARESEHFVRLVNDIVYDFQDNLHRATLGPGGHDQGDASRVLVVSIFRCRPAGEGQGQCFVTAEHTSLGQGSHCDRLHPAFFAQLCGRYRKGDGRRCGLFLVNDGAGCAFRGEEHPIGPGEIAQLNAQGFVTLLVQVAVDGHRHGRKCFTGGNCERSRRGLEIPVRHGGSTLDDLPIHSRIHRARKTQADDEFER